MPFGNSQVQMQYNALKIITLKQKKFHVLNSYQNFNCKTNKSKSANLYHTGLKRTLLRIESQDKDNNLTIEKPIQKNPMCPRITLKSKEIELNKKMNYLDLTKEMIHITHCRDHSAVVLTYVFIYMRVWPCMT